MAEDTKVPESTTEETQTPEGENPENKNPEEKKFVQKEVDSIVKNRLASKNAEISTMKQTYEQTIQEKEATIEQLQKALEGMIGSLLDGVTENEKLLLAKLPILDQIEFLNESKKSTTKQAKVAIPSTPKPTGEDKKFTPKPTNFKL